MSANQTEPGASLGDCSELLRIEGYPECAKVVEAAEKRIAALVTDRDDLQRMCRAHACQTFEALHQIAALQAKVDALERDRDRLHSALQKLVTRDESAAEEYSEQDWIEARRALSGVPLDAARQSKP